MSRQGAISGAPDDAAAWLAVLAAVSEAVGHHMNNPLAAVAANVEHVAAEIARSRDSTAPASILARSLEQPIEDMSEAARQMREFVNPLATTGTNEPASEIDVGELLDEALAAAASGDGTPAHATVRRRTDRRIVGKPGGLRRAFATLLRAAPELVIDVESTGDYVTIELRRANGGPAPWASTPEMGPAGDAGLSLLVALRLARASGGDLFVDATGALVRVLLPTSAVAAPPPNLDLQRAPQPSTRTARILVIDDEPLVARSVARTLRSAHEVTICQRAYDALTRIQAGEKFDAIICDLMMAEMSGMAFYEALKIAAPELAERTVFMTGGAFTPAARAFVERAARPLLGKPFSAGELRAAVDDLLRD